MSFDAGQSRAYLHVALKAHIDGRTGVSLIGRQGKIEVGLV